MHTVEKLMNLCGQFFVTIISKYIKQTILERNCMNLMSVVFKNLRKIMFFK